jgi:RNA polymerase sigma-70 factor, ECF subfamily
VTVPAEVDSVFRAEHGKVFAILARSFGDFELVSDAVQEAFVSAIEAWPKSGVPEKPAAWLTTVARNAATSMLRRRALAARKSEELLRDQPALVALEGDDVPDERLRLVFTCCHPALAMDARVTLTLHTMCGLDVDAIARLLLADPTAIAQRLVRAKRKIGAAKIPLVVPRAEELDERISGVLAVVYLVFTEGHDPTSGDDAIRPALCEEAIRLGRALCQLMPTNAESRGLLALMILHHARARGRVRSDGSAVSLEEQDRARWNADAIAEGTSHLDEALARGAPGPYQIQAAIAALHATAPSWEATDFDEIASLYEELWKRLPSPAVALSLAIARGHALGPEAGLATLDSFVADGSLDGFDRTHAARADLLRRAGRNDEAIAAYRAAITVARHSRERAFLERRLAHLAMAPR